MGMREMINKIPTVYDDNGEPRELPYKYEICGSCKGHGKSSGYLGAFTPAQLAEDPEFAEDYMRGDYDRPCEVCGGSGKVKVLDRAKTSKADVRRYNEQCAEERRMRAIERQERLMEGGWREEGWYGEC